MQSVWIFGRHVLAKGWVILAGLAGGLLGLLNELLDVAVNVPGWLGYSILALSVVVAFFWAFHDYRMEKDKELEETKTKLRAIEETAQFQVEAVLEELLQLKEALTHPRGAESDRELRLRTMFVAGEVREVVRNHARAFINDVNVDLQKGSGPDLYLRVVNENFQVLAAIQKKIQGTS